LNIFERKAYRIILGPVYGNENESLRILINKKIYAILETPTIIETVRLHRLLGIREIRHTQLKIY
jgi:hypothetical protein